MRYAIGLDVGGTNLSAGVVDEHGVIIARATRPAGAGRSIEAVTGDMVQVSREAAARAGLEEGHISAWGVGMPSCVNPKTRLLVHANCFGWRNVPIYEYLERRIPAPLSIENDANCAVLGEAVAGAAKGHRNAVMLTLGTGVGGGIILDGRLYAGGDGMGAELGHTKLVYGGRQCTCGQRGCLDEYGSARGLVITAREMLTERSLLWELCHQDVRRLDARMIPEAAAERDACAQAVWDQYLDHLAAAIGNFICVFRPEVILLGGGVSAAGDQLLIPLREKVRASTFAAEEIGIPEIRLAALGNDAGIIGAAMLDRFKAH